MFVVYPSPFHDPQGPALSKHRTREGAEKAARKASGSCRAQKVGYNNTVPATCACGGCVVREET